MDISSDRKTLLLCRYGLTLIDLKNEEADENGAIKTVMVK